MLIGKIVKVIHREHVLIGQEGVIVDVHPAGVENRIEVEFTSLAGRYLRPLGKTDLRLGLHPTHLRVIPHYSLGTRAGLAFGRGMWHILCWKIHPLNPLDTCCIAGCQDFVTARGICNVHGTVSELDMCLTHYNVYNDTCRDGLPPMKTLVCTEYKTVAISG